MSPRSVRFTTGLAYLGALGLLAGHGAAQCTPGCSAQGNAVLTAPTQVLPGSKLNLSLQGASNNLPGLIGLSTGAGPVCFSWGKICLSAPILTVPGSTPVNVSTLVPPILPTTIHLQGFVLDNSAPNGFVAISSSHSVTTLPGLSVYSDAGLFDTLGVYTGQGATMTLNETTSSSAPEGAKYMQCTFTLPAFGGWAGVFIQEGPFNTTTSFDMSSLQASGFLRFMIRSTNELELGIRSQNIGAGQETSKLLLRFGNYAKLDGTWESVSIPLSTFKLLDSRLDFSQMKIMFNLAVTRGFVSASTGTFDFDNVRWSN